MLGLFAFIILIIGAINWFFIGLLQYDFVAGLFGSQASIFSRIVYVAVGISSFIILAILIKNKGKVVFNLSKIKQKLAKRKKEKEQEKAMQNAKIQPATSMESSSEFKNESNQNEGYVNKMEASNDLSTTDKSLSNYSDLESAKEFDNNSKNINNKNTKTE